MSVKTPGMKVKMAMQMLFRGCPQVIRVDAMQCFLTKRKRLDEWRANRPLQRPSFMAAAPAAVALETSNLTGLKALTSRW